MEREIRARAALGAGVGPERPSGWKTRVIPARGGYTETAAAGDTLVAGQGVAERLLEELP